MKNRLAGLRGKPAATAGIGPGFSPAYEEEWNELVEQVDNYTQKIGAAVVQTWEVGAAELGRVVQGHAEDKMLVERWSDALVPFLTPFQDLHKKCKGAMAEGFAAGTEQGTLAAATAPLPAMLDGLGLRAVDGWKKMADYLEPLWKHAADPEAARHRFVAAAPRIQKACDDAQATLRRALDEAPRRPRLWDGVCDAFDAWQLALTRDIEVIVTEVARQAVRDVREGLGR